MGMGDARLVFNQTSWERRKSGRWAAAKKNGSKSKKCTMPSDYLSAAQKRKLNGEVKMYDISKPMSWSMFRQMPYDLQAEYLRKLAEMGAGREDVSRMMDTSKSALSQYLSKYHKGKNYFSTGKKKDHGSFLDWWDSFYPTAKKEEQDQADVKKAENAVPNTVVAYMASAAFTYEGSPKAIFEHVANLIADDKKYRITVSVEPLK